MMVNEAENSMLQDIHLLYELSLSIGNSTDIRENCERFLSTLMSRKNLSFVGYWIGNQENSVVPELIYAIPFKNFTSGKFLLDKDFTAELKKEKALIVKKGQSFFSLLSKLTQIENGEFMVYETTDSHFLILHRNIGFSFHEKQQLYRLVQKFGTVTKQLIVQKYLSRQENLMRKKIEEELKRTQNEHKTLFEYTFDAIFLYDSNIQQIVYRNPAFNKMFGFPASRTDINIGELIPEKQADGRSSFEHFAEHNLELARKKSIRLDFLHKKMNGDIFETESTIIVDERNRNNYMIILNDLTDFRTKEFELAQSVQDLNNKNVELEKYIDSNAELENFAYMASHDLQAPLRTIVSFTQMLQRSMKENITQDQKEFFEFIVNASQNMQQLIKKLLSYSRVNSKEKEIESINLNNLIQIITNELKINIEEKNAKIEISHLPEEIKGDRTRLRQLFQNLISNALKFVKSDIQPNIIISSEEDPDCWRFFVKDNGIGIEAEFQERIFGLFKRLHTKTEYEGTGIGLAMCQKIVEQHNGEISVESEFGKGSTFYFTISKDL